MFDICVIVQFMKKIRKQLGMTQGELGEALGITQGSISHIELGRAAITASIASKLIQVAKDRGVTISFNDIFQQ